MFDKYRAKRDMYANVENLEREYLDELRKHAMSANDDTVKFIEGYFLAKIELNRDVVGVCDPDKRKDRRLIKSINIENKMMAEFIEEIARIREQALSAALDDMVSDTSL